MAATPQQYLIHLQIYKILQTILESHLTSGSTSVASSYAILLLRSAALFSTLHGQTRQLYGVSKETKHGETPVASLERCHLTASARTKNVLGFFLRWLVVGSKGKPSSSTTLTALKIRMASWPQDCGCRWTFKWTKSSAAGAKLRNKMRPFQAMEEIRLTRSRSVSLSPRFTIPGEDFFQHWHTNESA